MNNWACSQTHTYTHTHAQLTYIHVYACFHTLRVLRFFVLLFLVLKLPKVSADDILSVSPFHTFAIESHKSKVFCLHTYMFNAQASIHGNSISVPATKGADCWDIASEIQTWDQK